MKIDGTFDRTGLPDPLLMDHCFALVGDKIAALTVGCPTMRETIVREEWVTN